MFNKSIVKKIKNYLKIRKQFGELYLTIRSKVDTLKDYGLQSVRPLNLLKSSYPINIVSKEDGILIKCEDDATRYWTTDDKETIFISMGKGVYKKTKNKPLEEVEKLYNAKFAHQFGDKAVMFSQEKNGMYTLKILFLNNGKVSNSTYVDRYQEMPNLNSGIELENDGKFQYFYLDKKGCLYSTQLFNEGIEKREGYQVICDEDGKYKVFKVSKVSGIRQVGDDTDVFESVKMLGGILGITHIGIMSKEKSKLFNLRPIKEFKSYEIPGYDIKFIGEILDVDYYQVKQKKIIKENNNVLIQNLVHLIEISEEGIPKHYAIYEADEIKIEQEMQKGKDGKPEVKIEIKVIKN